MTIQTLIKILQQHNVEVVGHSDDTITVASVYCKDGKAFEQMEDVKAELQAVREYLNY